MIELKNVSKKVILGVYLTCFDNICLIKLYREKVVGKD